MYSKFIYTNLEIRINWKISLSWHKQAKSKIIVKKPILGKSSYVKYTFANKDTSKLAKYHLIFKHLTELLHANIHLIQCAHNLSHRKD